MCYFSVAIVTSHTSMENIAVGEILFELVSHTRIIPGYIIKPLNYFLNI